MNISGKSRKYIGIDPAYLSILDGNKFTRTSTILVRSGHDAGEILSQGPWCRYKGPIPVTKFSAALHELMQEKVSDIPSLRFTIESIAKGKFSVGNIKHKDGCKVIYYNGKRLKYGGVDLAKN